MMLIDAHGPGHGLSVEVDITYSHSVTIKQWGELCEPDENGSYSPRIQEATIPLRDLLDKSGKHYQSANLCGDKSQHDKIVSLALAWLGYWGGSEEHVDDSDRPCDHFCMNYSGIGARRKPSPGDKGTTADGRRVSFVEERNGSTFCMFDRPEGKARTVQYLQEHNGPIAWDWPEHMTCDLCHGKPE